MIQHLASSSLRPPPSSVFKFQTPLPISPISSHAIKQITVFLFSVVATLSVVMTSQRAWTRLTEYSDVERTHRLSLEGVADARRLRSHSHRCRNADSDYECEEADGVDRPAILLGAA